MLPITSFLEQWSQTLGVPSRYEELTVEGMTTALPRGLGKEIAESSIWATEYGWDGGLPDLLMPKDVSLL